MKEIQNKAKVKILSWAMYDFANTIFAMNVISLYFALWVTIDMKGEDIYYSIALATSMFLGAITAPILGAISDRLGRKMPFLIIFTIICCIFTASIGFAHRLFLGLLFFTVANYCFSIADVFYNSLLTTVSPANKIGRISGFGTSLGYLGTIIGLAISSPFVLKYGRQATFVPTAVAFLLFALPCFIFVKDRKVKTKTTENIIIAAIKRVRNTFINIKKYSQLAYFMLAAFFIFNAINTAYIFMSVYIKKLVKFSDAQMLTFYIVASLFAIIGAFCIGFITDRLGAKKTFVGVLILWCIAAICAALFPTKPVFWVIGPVVGICLAGTWTAARTLVAELAPEEMMAEAFGFYGLVGKMATIVGPIIWGLAVWSFGSLGLVKYQLAIIILFLFLLIGMVVLRRI